jgi:hypothetical protein
MSTKSGSSSTTTVFMDSVMFRTSPLGLVLKGLFTFSAAPAADRTVIGVD